MIRLKRSPKDRIYQGWMNYIVAYDHMSGRKDRYSLLILNVGDPVTVGREINLATVRSLIAEYEEEAEALPFFGAREEVLLCLKRVSAKRRKASKAQP